MPESRLEMFPHYIQKLKLDKLRPSPSPEEQLRVFQSLPPAAQRLVRLPIKGSAMKKIIIEIPEDKIERTDILAGFDEDEITLSVSTRDEIEKRVKLAIDGVPQGQIVSFENKKDLMGFVKGLLE